MSAATSDASASRPGGRVDLCVDLRREELPSPENAAERWTFISHLRTAPEGEAVSVAISFDRQRIDRTGERSVHVVRWALCQPARGVYETGIDIDPTEWMHPARRATDAAMARALAELLVAKRLPAPERRMVGRPWIAGRGLELHYGGSLLARESDGCYRVAVGVLRGDPGIELYVQPVTPAVRWLLGVGSEHEFDVRCIVPDCRVDGSLWIDKRETRVTGHAHFERAYSRASRLHTAFYRERSSCLLSVRLGDGTTLDVCSTGRDPHDCIAPGRASALVMPLAGIAILHEQVSIDLLRSWQSTRSYYEYPVGIALHLPAAGIDLKADAVVSSQEQLAIVSGAPSWSGLMNVEGTLGGADTRGVAWMDRSGAQHDDVCTFFSAVNRHARSSVSSLLANPESTESLRAFVGYEDRKSMLPCIDQAALGSALLEPLRDMVARGGKSWRSFALLASIDAVGGSSQVFADWSALPELIHAGSLIVDDVEDQSAIRRGKPSCHRLFGEPLAINAGTAAYFLAELALRRCRLPADAVTRINQLYFAAMRAGHAGQALDLANLQEAGRVALDKGEFDELERRVHGINRLKTGVPGGAFSRMGAIAGGGSPDQTEALGTYFETVAVAFQIVDDVLNLRGFKGNLKQRGEDIRLGKITLPVVKALALLDESARRRLWESVIARSSDLAVVEDAMLLIDACGALQCCVDEARVLVDTAWTALDPALPDSFVKLNIRTFGLYVLDRQS